MRDALGVGLSVSDRRHVTSRFVALGHDFSVETSDPGLCRYLDSTLEPFASEGRSRTRYIVVDCGPDTAERYELYFEDEFQLRASGIGSVLAYLFWHLNSRVVAESDYYLLLHAAAVERDGRALILPAQSGSGKTTLTGGLLQAGFRYLTDEAVAIDPSSGLIEPFCKPLSIESSSWRVLPGLEPGLISPHRHEYATTNWLVNARWIRPDALAPPSRPAFVISPAYRAGAATRLVPIRPAETVMMLVENSFNFAVHGQRGLDLLASVARQAPGYRLEMSDLDQACRLVMELIDTPRHDGGNSDHDEWFL